MSPVPRADGAIFDVRSSTWRQIPDAPVAILDASAGAVGDAVHVWEPDATGGGALLAYDVGDDRWARLRPPEGLSDLYALTAADDMVVFSPGRDGDSKPPIFAFEPASGSWSTLPPDPLPPLYDRSLVWTGSELVLLGAEAAPDGEAPHPSLFIAAAFDPVNGNWRRLPDSEILAGYGQEWVAESGVVVSTSRGTVDGGAVNGFGREYPLGGILDPRTGTWEPLPPPSAVQTPTSDATPVVDRPVGGDGDVTAHGGMLLDVRERAWVALPPDERLPDAGSSSAWAAGRLVLFGGVRWDGGDAVLSNDIWTWPPPG